MYKFLILFSLLGFTAKSQVPALFDTGTKWILKTPKIEKKQLQFVAYSPEKVDMNTMIWTFLPGGFIEYDYESSADIYACAGVDFLDMDITECRWDYDATTMTFILLVKGGYASLDDFIFKRRYNLTVDDSDEFEPVYNLEKDYEYYFNDLTRKSKK